MVLIETSDFSIKSFRLGSSKFFVDVVIRSNEFEAWLYHQDCGIKDFMFGLPLTECNNLDDFVCIVIDNLNNESYLDFYKNEYMD